MIHEHDIEKLVKERLGHDVQFQRKERIKESPRSVIDRYHFSNDSSIPYSIICKSYPEQTQEAVVYAYFHAHHLFNDVVLYAGSEQNQAFILLHDLSQTHQNISSWNPPVAQAQLERIIHQIAWFHSRNWRNYANLVQLLGLPWHLQSMRQYRQYLDHLRRDALEFKRHAPFPMTHEQFAYYDHALDYLHDNASFLFEHLHENSLFTFIHGDLNVCNLYYPLDQQGDIVMLDYEALRVGLFTDDFVMLFIHDLYHGAAVTQQLYNIFYHQLPDDIRTYLTPELFAYSFRTSLRDGLFFPMKLFTHFGVNDRELVMKSLEAYEHLIHSQNVGIFEI